MTAGVYGMRDENVETRDSWNIIIITEEIKYAANVSTCCKDQEEHGSEDVTIHC